MLCGAEWFSIPLVSGLRHIFWYGVGLVSSGAGGNQPTRCRDGSTDVDVGGMDAREDQSPAGCTPVADLPAGRRGAPHNAMAHRWETSRPTVRLWRTGFNEAGPLGSIRRCPGWASAHRLLPRKVRASVARIEDAHRWHPHRIETFKRSKATRCVETLTDVVTAIDEFIRLNNKNPKPFVWTQPVDERLKKIPHGNAVIETPP